MLPTFSIVLNLLLGMINLSTFYRMRSIGYSGIFPASLAVFNFATAALISFMYYVK